MLVACHPGDLRAAADAELRTGYVTRPLENGPDAAPPAVSVDEFDVMAADFVDLARRLGIDRAHAHPEAGPGLA